MSKAAKIQDTKFVVTPDYWYQSGRRDYLEAAELMDEDGDQQRINSLFDDAACGFWRALILGHLEAPYSLAICFNDGMGVKEDKYLGKLFFGVALALNDPKCQKRIDDFQIPGSMNQAIKDLTVLISQIHSSIDIHNEVNAEEFLNNMQLLGNSIKVPHLPRGDSIGSLFMKGVDSITPTVEQATDYTTDYQSSNYGYQQDNSIVLAGNSNDDSCCCTLF